VKDNTAVIGGHAYFVTPSFLPLVQLVLRSLGLPPAVD
jgi:hypothetical protein